MSTKLTKKGTSMVDSLTLQLVVSAAEVQELASQYLCAQLMNKGYIITPASLNFLSTLECGVNYASEIARNIGVSRQMVAKTVKELCNKGYLEQLDGSGKQKQILFTEKGEKLISESRKLLAKMDKRLIKQFSEPSLGTTLETLNATKKMLLEK